MGEEVTTDPKGKKTPTVWCCLCNTRHPFPGRCPEHALSTVKEEWPGLFQRMVDDGTVDPETMTYGR